MFTIVSFILTPVFSSIVGFFMHITVLSISLLITTSNANTLTNLYQVSTGQFPKGGPFCRGLCVSQGNRFNVSNTGLVLLLEVLEKPWNLILDSKGA